MTSADDERRKLVTEIADRVRAIGALSSNQKLDPDDGLLDVLGIDSIVILETLVWLESEHGLFIADEDLVVDMSWSIGRMADYVIANQKGRSRSARPDGPQPQARR